MEIFISEKCINCGACNQIYDEVFDMTKYGATPNNDRILDEDKCLEAVFNCPVDAIYIK